MPTFEPMEQIPTENSFSIENVTLKAKIDELQSKLEALNIENESLKNELGRSKEAERKVNLALQLVKKKYMS